MEGVEWGSGDTVVVLPYPGQVGVDQVTHVHTISFNFSVYSTLSGSYLIT